MMDAQNPETTAEPAERRELSAEQMDAVSGGTCSFTRAIAAALNGGRLMKTWVSMGCPK